MNVLLIEPDRVLAETYGEALKAAGHAVTICASGQAGIFCADENRPDVVILELQLVGHSGLEFLYELRSYTEWQDIPVVVHSHVPAGEFENNWDILKDHLGVHAYHYKPFTSLQTLMRSVNNFATLSV